MVLADTAVSAARYKRVISLPGMLRWSNTGCFGDAGSLNWLEEKCPAMPAGDAAAGRSGCDGRQFR